MKITGFIARRYLFSKKHVSLISSLTMISVTGVTIGTALLIIVLSVFNGFFDVIKGFLLNNDPDIRIESAEGQPFAYRAELQRELGQIPVVSLSSSKSKEPKNHDISQISVVSPYISGKALLTAGKEKSQVVQVKGIHPASYKKLHDLQQNIEEGTLDLSVKHKQPGILLSRQLLRNLNLVVGDEVALLSADGMRKSLTQFSMPRMYRFRVTGAYSMTQIVDESPAYIDMQAAQRLFNFRKTISGVNIELQNHEQAEAVKARLETRLSDRYKISTWYDLQKPLYDVMYLEKWGSYLILMIIVIVAVLNIVGSLTMIVIQKSRDIGVLLTMGYTPAQIKQIFITQGVYIGLIGCLLGGGIGLLCSWLQQQYGLVKLSSAFIINAYPVSIHAWDVVIVLLGSLLLCVLASWYPAKRAADIDPADVIRYE